MPPSRFNQVSRYRNATISLAKPHERYTELGLGALPDSGVGRLVAVTPVSSHVLARSSASSNSLLVLPSETPRKYAKQPPVLHGVCQGVLADFDLARFQSDEHSVILAAGSTSGSIAIRAVALLQSGREDQQVSLPAQAASETVLSSSHKGGVTSLQFHPGCPSLLLSGSLLDDQIQLWDVQAGSNVLDWNAGSPQWDVKWSIDGRLAAGCGKDATVRIWDARTRETVSSIPAHASKVKPTKASFITEQTAHLLLTTGFSQMRQREIAIWDHRNASSPLKRITLDVASSALEPICDHDRGMVYMVAKGDSSVRWIDVGSQDQGASFAEGVYPLDFSASSAALGPSALCDPSTGEIAKIFIAAAGSGGSASSSDAIVPASVRVPRRNYIDFHADLYPDTAYRGAGAGIEVGSWVVGKDAELAKVSLDPALKGVRPAGASSRSAPPSATAPAPVPKQAKIAETKANGNVAEPEPRQVQQQARSGSESTNQADPISSLSNTLSRDLGSQTTPAPVQVTAHAPALTGVATTRANKPTVGHAHWSRRPLAGSTPLIPAYQNLSALDISRGPDARMMAVSRRFLFLPISGPGGRLGVHPLDATGRLPLHMPCFVHGTPLVDFAPDPFNDDQVITIAADGTLRLWNVPEPTKGEQGWQLPGQLDEQPKSSVRLSGVNKVADLAPHPFVQGLVAVLPADAEGKLHLVDMSTADVLASLKVPGDGTFSAAWSPDGSVLAVCAKDRKVYILDVRGSRSEARVLGEIAAHDSPRSCRPVWIDGEHLLTVGHTVGSLRQLKLFRIGGATGVEEMAKHNMDASPSVLFPTWDGDTGILWLWSKGERIVSSIEVQPKAGTTAKSAAAARSESGAARSVAAQQQQAIFTPLPAFQHGTPQLGLAFLPKDCLDVRSVEVGSAVRLSKSEVQRVAWNVPRSRPEFFQDDVYPPTLLVRQPLLDAQAWMAGQDVRSPPLTSLQPEGMVPLSEAPPPQQKVSSLSKGPTVRQLTEKEREEAMLTDIFAKAKGKDDDKDPNHNEDQAARAPDDDDWDDD